MTTALQGSCPSHARNQNAKNRAGGPELAILGMQMAYRPLEEAGMAAARAQSAGLEVD